MPINPIGPLPAVPSSAAGSPSIGAEALQALGTLPQVQQQMQLQKAQTADQMSQLDDKRLAQIAQMAQSNPEYAANPQLLRTVSDIFHRRGLPPPVKSDSTGRQALDFDMLLPKQQFADLAPQQLEYYGGLQPEQRKAAMSGIVGAPSGFLEMPQTYALGSGQRTAIQNELAKQMQTIADPKGAGPEGFMAWVRANRQNLGAIGVDPSQLTSDPLLMGALDKRADAESQRLMVLGVLKPEAEIQYKQGLTQYYQGKLQNDQQRTQIMQQKEQLDQQRLAGQLQRWQTENQTSIGRLAVAQQNLQRLMQIQGPGGAGATLKYAGALQKDLQRAQTAYDSLTAIAQRYASAYQPVPVDIQDRLDALQTQIQTLQPQVEGAEQSARTQLQQGIRSTSGASHVEMVKPPQQSQAQSRSYGTYNGKRVYSEDGGKTWNYVTQ